MQIILNKKYTVQVESRFLAKHGYYDMVYIRGFLIENGHEIEMQAHQRYFEKVKQDIIFDIISCPSFNSRERVFGSILSD